LTGAATSRANACDGAKQSPVEMKSESFYLPLRVLGDSFHETYAQIQQVLRTDAPNSRGACWHVPLCGVSSPCTPSRPAIPTAAALGRRRVWHEERRAQYFRVRPPRSKLAQPPSVSPLDYLQPFITNYSYLASTIIRTPYVPRNNVFRTP
jgi:hypothetical protein